MRLQINAAELYVLGRACYDEARIGKTATVELLATATVFASVANFLSDRPVTSSEADRMQKTLDELFAALEKDLQQIVNREQLHAAIIKVVPLMP